MAIDEDLVARLSEIRLIDDKSVAFYQGLYSCHAAGVIPALHVRYCRHHGYSNEQQRQASSVPKECWFSPIHGFSVYREA